MTHDQDREALPQVPADQIREGGGLPRAWRTNNDRLFAAQPMRNRPLLVRVRYKRTELPTDNLAPAFDRKQTQRLRAHLGFGLSQPFQRCKLLLEQPGFVFYQKQMRKVFRGERRSRREHQRGGLMTDDTGVCLSGALQVFDQDSRIILDIPIGLERELIGQAPTALREEAAIKTMMGDFFSALCVGDGLSQGRQKLLDKITQRWRQIGLSRPSGLASSPAAIPATTQALILIGAFSLAIIMVFSFHAIPSCY